MANIADFPSSRRRFEPRNPNFLDVTQRSFARQGVMALLGARLQRVEPGVCEIQLPYREALSQQHDYFHGGLVTTVADSAAGFAAYSLASEHTTVLTVEFKVNFLAPARGELLIATGEVLRPGRTLIVTEGRVLVERAGRRTLCATMLQTIMNVTGHSERD